MEENRGKEPELDDDSGEAAAGVIIALLGSTLQALGLTLMKRHLQNVIRQAEETAGSRAHLEVEAAQRRPERVSSGFAAEFAVRLSSIPTRQEVVTYFKSLRESALWIFGFFLFVVGNVGDFLAFGLVSQMMVTLIGSWGVVVNTFTAHLLLGEKTTFWDILAAVCIVVGISFTVIFGGADSEEWTTDELIEQYKEDNSLVMFIVLFILTVSGLYAMGKDYYRRKRIADEFGLMPEPSRTMGTLYCLMAALVGCITVTFASATSGILKLTMEGTNQFTDPLVGVIVALFLISLPSQMFLINVSLAINDALFHIPNYYVFWNLGSIVTGAVFYEETSDFDLETWVGFCAGVLILFLGVYLTNASASQKKTERNQVIRKSRAGSMHIPDSSTMTGASEVEKPRHSIPEQRRDEEKNGWTSPVPTPMQELEGRSEGAENIGAASGEFGGYMNKVSGISAFVHKNTALRGSGDSEELRVEELPNDQSGMMDLYTSSGPRSARVQSSRRGSNASEAPLDRGQMSTSSTREKARSLKQESEDFASRGDITVNVDSFQSLPSCTPRGMEDLPGSVGADSPLHTIPRVKSPSNSDLQIEEIVEERASGRKP